jgi:signal transduction histidine kinase
MDIKNWLRKQSLLKSLSILQVAVIILTALFFSLTMYFVALSSDKMELSNLKQKIQNQLLERYDELSTWKQLGLDEAIEADLQNFYTQYPIHSFEFLYLDQDFIDEEQSLAIPARNEILGNGKYRLIVNLDPARQRSVSIFATTWIPLILFCLTLLILIIYLSGYFVRHWIHRPLESINRAFEQYKLTGDFDLSRVDGRGEIEDFTNNLKEIYLHLKQTQNHLAKTQVSRQVAHDIRSPLSAILVGVGRLEGESSSAKSLIQSAAERLVSICNDLLKISQKSGGELKLSTEREQNIAFCIRSLLLEKELEHLSSGIRWSFQDHLPHRVPITRSRGLKLKRMLSNLINNSVEAMPHGGIIAINVCCSSSGEIQVTIADKGSGVSPEHLENLNSKTVFSTKSQGHGLGVRHTREIVESWGGRLFYKNNQEQGLTAVLNFPMQSPVQMADQSTTETYESTL